MDLSVSLVDHRPRRCDHQVCDLCDRCSSFSRCANRAAWGAGHVLLIDHVRLHVACRHELTAADQT